MDLTRDPADKKRYVLAGVGELRTGSWLSSTSTLTASDGSAWEVGRKGLRQRVAITDATGGEPATWEPTGTFSRGGRLDVAGVGAFELKPSSNWKERYALVGDGRELATIEAGGWSLKRPVKVAVESAVAPMVLLCACWLVKQFSDDSAASTAATSAA